MNKKRKLLRKLNVGIIKIDLWNRVVKFALELAQYGQTQAKKNFNKNREIAKEMIGEDYSEDLKSQFEAISEMEPF